MKKFHFYHQPDQMDCGPTCLRMIAKHHWRSYSMDSLRRKSGINREGVSLLGISEAAEEIGFRTVGAKLTWEQLEKESTLPCIIYWNQVHFVVVYRIKGDKVTGPFNFTGIIRFYINGTLSLNASGITV